MCICVKAGSGEKGAKSSPPLVGSQQITPELKNQEVAIQTCYL